MNRRVILAAEWVPSYQERFYLALSERLEAEGVEFSLIYGDPPRNMARRPIAQSLDWATHRPNRTLPLGRRSLVWQPVLDQVGSADLVIVEQASRLLVNYWLLAQQLAKRQRVALWGHGANLNEPAASRTAEAIKRWISLHPHWWFAYTDGTRDRIAALGYPPERITVVQNAGATDVLREDLARLTRERETELRAEMDLGDGPVGLYMGSLYDDKRLDFLLAAVDEVTTRRPDFELVVAGDGPLREQVADAAARRPHVVWVGHIDGERKAALLRAAEVMLLPGAVGLAIVDGFAAGVPAVSTAVATHGPEIEYLQPGENGILIPGDATTSDYADAVLGAISDGGGLRAGAARTGGRLSTEGMVERFREGIMCALSTRPAATTSRSRTRVRDPHPKQPRITTVLTTSWDDGTPEDLELGELLSRYGFLGTFYATTGPVGGRTISDSALDRLVALGHEIGNHGCTHRKFTELETTEILDEVRWGQTEIQRFMAPKPVVAPPGGATTGAINRLLNGQGLTVRTAPILGGRRRQRGVMVPTAQVFPHSLAITVRHLVRRRVIPATEYLRAWSASRTVRDRLTQIIETATADSVIHFWGHSQEIERLGLWRELELVLEHAAESGLVAATNGTLAASEP